MGINQFDLHTHSYFSDGQLSPQDLVRECKKAGIKVVALTDHESIRGIPWAISEGKKLGIKVIPGIELSAEFNGLEHHLLGLSINYKSEELANFIKRWEITKKKQIEAMVRGLQGIGFKLEFNEVAIQSCGALNRAHIAYAVTEKPENNAIMEREGVKSSSEFFVKFLKEDSPVYARRDIPQIIEVIDLIKRLNGTAIWAHPFYRIKNTRAIRNLAVHFKTFGLDGLEVGYSSDYQSLANTMALHQVAEKLSMIETGGSDFHSSEMPVLNKVGNFESLDGELRLPEEVSQCFT